MYEGTDPKSDPFEYIFLIEPKKQYVQIDITDIATDNTIITYYIHSNVAFKEEPEDTLPIEPPEDEGEEEEPSDPGEEGDNSDEDNMQQIDMLRRRMNKSEN